MGKFPVHPLDGWCGLLLKICAAGSIPGRSIRTNERKPLRRMFLTYPAVEAPLVLTGSSLAHSFGGKICLKEIPMGKDP